jgi:TonB family protein
VHWLAVALSTTFHFAVTVGVFFLAYRSLDAAAPMTENPAPIGRDEVSAIAIDLPTVSEGSSIESDRVDPIGEWKAATGGESVAHLDEGLRGRGGEMRASTQALNFADRDEHLRLSPDLFNRLDRDQLQRLRVRDARRSWDDRRSTTHPAELTLVATGSGTLPERRAESRAMPNRGLDRSPPASIRGSPPGAPSAFVGGEDELRVGGAYRGSREGAPGVGVPIGRAGSDHRSSAPIASARPAVTRGPVAVAADEAARPTDDVDSDQEVATTVRSLVHASTVGGAAGEGEGGSGGGGAAGTGGLGGPGSRARPFGDGDSDAMDYWTGDTRFFTYFRQIHRRLDPLWANAFPKSALFELKQGMVILEFTVFSDGRAVVSWPPLRSSGVDEFDRNCAEAIRRASPFPPIPRELGLRNLRIRAPFVANNPIIK